MAGGGVLNADLNEVGAWLRGGVRWWIGELRGLLPASLRGGEALRLHPPASGADWRLTRRNREMAIDEAARGRAPVTIAMPPESALLRPVAMPALPPADLARMLALDLDRLAPLPAGEAAFDWEIAGRDTARERIDVLRGVVRRSEAERLRDEAVALGLRPVRIAVLAEDGALRFDFLRGLAGDAPLTRDRRRWWVAVAALFACNLALLVGRDIVGTNRLEAAVEAAAPAATASRALEGRLAGETRRTAQALLARDRHEPLRVLAAITATLPAGAWAQRLAWDGRTVRIAGYKQPGLDVLAALRRSPMLRGVRESGGDSAATTVAAQPYDVSALVAPPR